MSLRYAVSAVLLFAAAAGWVVAPPSERDPTPPSLRQDGRVTLRLQTPDPSRTLGFRLLPPACVLLGVGALLAGWHHRHERD